MRGEPLGGEFKRLQLGVFLDLGLDARARYLSDGPRHDADGDEAVKRGENPPALRLRRHVTVSDGRAGDDGPITPV